MIALVLIACATLRLISINQSFWLDEAISANVATNLAFKQILTGFSPNDFQPPLYYFFLKFWITIFGNSVFSIRLPSILFSLVTIFLVYEIGKFVKDKKTGLWAAILTGFNPLLIYYSQEARMYSMTVMFLTAALFFFLKLQKHNDDKKSLLFFNIFSFLSFYGFYGSIFLLASFGLFLIVKKKFKLFLKTNIGIALAVLTIAPLLLTQIRYSKIMLQNVTNWTLVLGKVNLKNLILIPVKFGLGRINFYPKFIYYLIGSIWSFILYLPLLTNIKKIKPYFFFVVATLSLGILFSFKSPLMQYFRFQYLIPILSLCLALIVKNQILKIVQITGLLSFALVYLFNPKYQRENWKDLVGTLNQNDTVYMISSVADPIKYYQSTIKVLDYRESLPTASTIKVIPYAEEIHGVDHNEILKKSGYKKTESQDFNEVVLEMWKLSD